MSKVIDERVVSMQFDNKQFESNVQTTMSTLDKLKAKLNFKGSAKGLESISTAATKCNLSPLSNAVDNVGIKFNGLYTIADQALRNITNSAMSAGKRIVSALTIDPVKTGFSEYETKINAVQVIKANTRGKYATEEEQMETIYGALDKLNEYADRTIYNFTQMTDNVGKFVAQTGDIEKSVKAVEGLANLAGASGASASDMARATYQMSQALGGTIRKIDWNSLRNANMAGIELKNMLTDLAKVKGIDIDSMIAEKGTFEDTLEEGWLSGDLFLEAMNIYSDAYSEAELAAMGFNDAQIKNFKDLAATARQATTEVKTVSQMWDVLKETAQSGWTKTWELIVGDFDSAKALLSPLAEFFMGVINNMSDARNNLLEGALNLAAPWKSITDKLNGKGLRNIKKVTDSIMDMTDKLTYFQDVVNDVWRGDYKTSDTGRFEMLEAAGYDHRVVQDLVNLGYGYKITVEDIEASHRKFGLTLETNAEQTEDVADALSNLSDEKLREAGLTEAEIKLYRDLAAEAERTGKSINEIADEMSNVSGRSLLLESLKNVGQSIVTIFTAMGNAWREIFPPMSVVRLYSIIKSINEFSKTLVISDETAGELTRVFKGLFAVIDIIGTVLGGGFRLAFKAVSGILGLFNLDILDAAAYIGDMLVNVRDWIDEHSLLNKVLEKFGPKIKEAVESIGDWADRTKPISTVMGAISSAFSKASSVFSNWADELSNTIQAVRKWFSGISEAENMAEYIADGIISAIKTIGSALTGLGSSAFSKIKDILGFESLDGNFFEVGMNAVQGFANGILQGVKLVWNVVKILATRALESICTTLEVNSPSKKFYAIGGFVVLGLIGGLIAGIPSIREAVTKIGSSVLNTIKEFDYSKLISVIILGGVLIGFLRIAKAIQNFSKPFEAAAKVMESAGEVVEGVADTVKNFAKVVKSYSGLLKAKAVKELAIGLGIIAASVAVLSFIPAAKLWGAVGAMAALAAVLIGMSFAISLLNKIPSVDFGKTSLVILAVSVSVLLMASAMKKLEGLNPETWGKTIASFAIAVLALGGLIVALGLSFKKDTFDIGGSTALLFKITAAMTVFALLCKVLGSMSPQEAITGTSVIVALGALLVGIMFLLKKASDPMFIVGSEMMSKSLVKIAGALLMMGIVSRILGGMTPDEMAHAGLSMLGFVAVITVLTLITKLVGKNDFSKLGTTLLQMAGSIAIMTIAVKSIGRMEWGEMAKAGAGIVAFVGVIALLTLITKIATKDVVNNLGKTILGISAGMLALAFVAKVIGGMEWGEMAKAGVGLLGLVIIIRLLVSIAQMVKPTELAKIGGTVFAISASMLMLAAACGLLSLFNPGKILVAAVALGVMMLAMASIIKSLQAVKDVKNGVGTIVALTIAILTLSVALGALSFIAGSDMTSFLATTAVLVAIMGMFSVLMLAAGKLNGSLGNLITMTVAIGLIGGLLYLLTTLPDPSKALWAAGALSLVLLALAGGLAIAGKFGSTGAGLGLLAASAGIIAISAALWLLASVPWQQLLAGGIALIAVLAGIVGAGVLLTMFAPGVAALTAVLLAFSAVILAVGVSMIAFSGSLYIAGLALPLLGEGFGVLGEGLKTFITTIASCYENAGKFIITMLALSAGITVFGLALAVVSVAAIAFSAALLVLGVAILAASVGALAFAAALYIVGLALPLIGNGLTVLGEGLHTFITTVASCKDSVGDFAEVMSTLGTTMLEFLLKLSGGLAVVGAAAVVFGAGCLVLAAGLVVVGASIVVVAAGVLALGVAFVGLGVGAGVAALGVAALGLAIAFAIDTVIGAIFGISDRASNAGRNLVEGFAAGITSAIETVKNAVGGFVNSCVSTICNLLGIESPSKVAQALGLYTGEGFALGLDQSTEKVNESAGNLANAAQTSMDTAGTEGSTSFMNSLGEGIDLSSVNVGSLDMETLKSSLSGAGTEGGNSFITGLTNKLDGSSIDIGSFDLSSLTSSFGSVGEDSGTSFLNGFSSNISMSNMDLGSFDMSSITSMFGTGGTDAAASFTEGVNSASDDATLEPSLTKMLGEVSNSSPKFAQAGEDLVASFIRGIGTSSSGVTTKINAIITSAVASISNKAPAFYGAGSNLAQSFANGISANSFRAVAKAKAMAEAAVEAAREALDINSPSKVFMALGKSIPEGFAKGIDKFSNGIDDSSITMARDAIDGTKNAIARVADLLSTDIDSQPTIRPVLDLSDVKSGASSINGLFGMQPSVDLLANVGSINATMNGRQNVSTTNDDVVAAIKDLKDALGKSSGDSYSIGDITYDDGSNIATTIQALIRASRIEGRI